MKTEKAVAELDRLASGRDVALGKMLRWRVRYFTDGAVIGSRGFVDEIFAKCRERFGGKRKGGARNLRGKAAAGLRRVFYGACGICGRGLSDALWIIGLSLV
jgi:hypothetical protein